ncbi:MAG: GerMN domain-containing protein [Firmicutes bacterium]|nr:GerMN domain-containing protein [Bacillota bacterium]
MGWKGRVAILWLAVFLIFIIRLLWAGPPAVFKDGLFYPVYFASHSGESLIPEFRKGQGSIDRLLGDLKDGPRLKGFVPILPPEVEILGYEQRGDLLLVDFSQELISNHPGGSRGELMTVYGIVNTLVGVSGVERVQILVEGQSVNTLVGHLNLSKPFKKDYTLLGSSFI